MTELRGLGALSYAYLLQSLRSKTALFWTLGFPQIWLFAFALIFGGGTSEGVTAIMPGLFTLTIFSGSFFGVSYTLVSERERGILRRYRVTPVSALVVVLANGVRSTFNVMAGLVLQAGLAWLFFGIHIASSAVTLGIVIMVGIFAFVPLGLILGSVAKDMRSAPALGNLVFVPMMLLSGAAVPFRMLPGWVQGVGRMLPATYLTESLQGAVVRGEGVARLGYPLIVLLVTGLVAAMCDGLLFRWESDAPIGAKRLTIAAVGLLIVYGAAALFAPSLQIATGP